MAAEDGTYSEIDEHGNILLASVSEPNNTKILVSAQDVKDPRSGEQLQWNSWKLSADMQYVLFGANKKQQWRHSSHANYFVHRLSDHATFALHEPSDPPTVAYVEWSPVSHSIAYVSSNDLYVIPADELAAGKPKAIRVTNDGSDVVFNGVPDWVYEEEVVQLDYTLYWSPNGQNIAYMRMNETEVKEYNLQIYNPSDDAFAVNPYTTEVVMRYPKPGTPLPLVEVHTFSLGKHFANIARDERAPVDTSKKVLHWPEEMPQNNRIIVEVAWVGDDALIVKEIDRPARVGQVILFTNGSDKGQVVRKLGKDGEEGDDGWIDHGQNTIAIKQTSGALAGYVDIVPKDGYDHIAFFSPVNSSTPIWLTSGEWEVTNIAGVDNEAGIVYFIAANPSIDRHVYAVELPDVNTIHDFRPQMHALTDTTQPGYHGASFSPKAGFYSLTYEGPNVPWQRVVQTGDEGLDVLLEDNAALNDTLGLFHRPLETRSTLEVDGNELNIVEIYPPNIDMSGRKKYPVLIHVYGGPYSQMVDNRFKRDWHTFLACEQKYIIVRVDGRGTGFKGRKLRNPIRDDLGHWEVEDQAALARELVKRKYVDRKRVGIWGWSYGGFMTLKTLESYNDLFTLGMAVAPVTNWQYYDAVYTERYMNTPEANPEGYKTSAINNVTAYEGLDLLLAHGTGDDNVHFSNMASLIDKLTASKVRGWRMRAFTDSAHSIVTRGANRELYEWMLAYLEEKWGHGGKVEH